MDNLADKQIRAARTLFNLAHCYLRSINIDDEQEKKNEEDEKDFQQTEKEEVNVKEHDQFDKKLEKKPELDNEIELYLQVQVDSKYQQQLCTNVQNKDLKKKIQKPEIEIELKIEIPQEFDSSYLTDVDKKKQNFETEVIKKSKNINRINQKKQSKNKQELICREINADSEFQYSTEEEIRLKQNISKDNVLVDLSGKNVDCSKTQNQIQKVIENKSQEKDNSATLLELELQEQKNLHENLMETFNRSVQRRIERLICKVPIKEQKIDKELCQEIEELNNEVKNLDPENYIELNKDILKEIYNKDNLPVYVKYLKELYSSFNQEVTPFYSRLDQLSNDKTQTTVQQKLNEEFLKKLDSLLKKKCNKEIEEGHQHVDSAIKHVVNKDVKMIKENEKIKLKKDVGLQEINEKYQNYDLVIQYNHEMSQELKGNAQQSSAKKILVNFHEDALKTFIHQADANALKEKLCNLGTDVIIPTPKEGHTNLNFSLEFFKNVQFEDKLQKKNEKKLQNYTEGEINKDRWVKTKENEINEVQEDSDVEIEDLDEEIQGYSENANDKIFEKVHENSIFKIGASEKAIIVESGVKIKNVEKETEEDSDVDIEGFEGEILEFPEIKIEDFDEESLENTDVDSEDLSEEGFNDINEVVEIVEDIEVELDSSVDNCPLDKIPTSTSNELNFKTDPNSKLTHDKNEKLKVINSSDPTIDHNKQKQTFFELKHQLDEISQEYRGYVQQKVFKELQQKIDDKQLQEMKIFPDTFNDEVNLNIKEDFQKEIDELQGEWSQLKPEFMSDVPLSFKEDNSSKKIKKKPFNLFDKLHNIHRQLLCKFANSKEWPENCFQPSSLLDVLFDDPTEFKPNVLEIILHSINKGYSIRINTDKNLKSPKEYCFNYCEDTILEHMENEHLPPELLDLLDSAEPRLFYSGCVIAEIHDQVDEIPGRVYRLLLRPFNMSIQRDIDRIIAKNSHATDANYWTYNKRLKLESILLKKSYPVMCMDSSPIAGLVVNLQHQMLSCRTIVLNPLKRKNNCSEVNPTKLPNEPQEVSSKLMDTGNTNIDNYILWKFDFRIKSLNLFKMSIIIITETQEFSMLLCTNPKVVSIKNMRFKIQLKQNELKTFINMMLEILQQKISPDIEVVRRYKCQDNSAPLSLRSVPSLLNDNIYKARHADISQLMDIFINNSHIKFIPINKMLENMSDHNSGITKLGCEKSVSSLMQEKLVFDTEKTDETKENYRGPDIKKSMQFCATKKLSTNSKKFLDVSNMDLKDKIADSSSLKTQTIPKDILFDDDSMFFLKEKSTTTETNSFLEPSLLRPILDLSKMDLKDKTADSTSLKTQTIRKNILFNGDTMPLFKEKSTNTETNSSLEPSLIRPIHVVSENDNFSDLVQEKILPVSSSSVISIFSILTTTKPIESSPAVVLSSLSQMNSLVTSIKTYMLPIESSSLGYIAKSESLPLQTVGEHLLTSTFNDDINTKIELLPVMQQDDLIHLTKVDDIAVNMFYYMNQITPTSCMMSSNENIFTMFSKSDCLEGREVLEDKYMLRCLQLFHQKPTLSDISILPNTQKNEDEFPDI